MQIKEVSFRRKFNLGNYETMDIKFVATVSENEDVKDVLQKLDVMTIQYRKERGNI